MKLKPNFGSQSSLLPPADIQTHTHTHQLSIKQLSPPMSVSLTISSTSVAQSSPPTLLYPSTAVVMNPASTKRTTTPSRKLFPHWLGLQRNWAQRRAPQQLPLTKKLLLRLSLKSWHLHNNRSNSDTCNKNHTTTSHADSIYATTQPTATRRSL